MTAQTEVTVFLEGKYFTDGKSRVSILSIYGHDTNRGVACIIESKLDSVKDEYKAEVSEYIKSECGKEMFAITVLSIAQSNEVPNDQKVQLAMERLESSFNYPTTKTITRERVSNAMDSLITIFNTPNYSDKTLCEAMAYFFG